MKHTSLKEQNVTDGFWERLPNDDFFICVPKVFLTVVYAA